MAELRDYQRELLQEVLHRLETDDRKRVMMQLPTGGGKTVIVGALLAELLKGNRRAVWLTHRRELVEQTGEMLNRAGVRTVIDRRWPVGEEAQARRGSTVILMAQTTGSRASKGMIWGGYNANDLMVIDEAHHVPAKRYAEAMEQWPGMVLGMTATPWRLSEKEGFDHLFSQLVCGPRIADLQARGALCKAKVLVPSEGQRIKGGRPGQTGDYIPSGITRANESRVMTAEAVNVWKRYAADRPTIAYAVSKEHARNLQAFFQDNDNDIRAEVILSNTERERRRAAIDGFKRGYVRVLINVLVATEGFDLPDASCVLMARPTKSLGLYLQMAGRGLRPKPGGGDCLILDLSGNTLEHGLPEAHRNWSLAPRGKQEAPPPPNGIDDGVSETGGKTCGRCGRLRGWRHWEYEHHCGDAHDLVCDLCHRDAHIEAHLPVSPSLTTLVVPERVSVEVAKAGRRRQRGRRAGTRRAAGRRRQATERAALVALYYATDGPNWIRKDNWLTDAPLDEWYGVTVDDHGCVDMLDLDGNQLFGQLPAELGNLTSLSRLNLAYNELNGEIPRQLAHLTNLTWLSLGANKLSGEIPQEFGRLTNLEFLSLGNNELSGEIPSGIGNITGLTWLYLGHNQLIGEIPSTLGHLTDLELLALGQNRLSGEIPGALGDLINLERLDLSSNQLAGEIPDELARLVNLTSLDLMHNELSGAIPLGVGLLTKLRAVSLGINELSGEIPPTLGRLSSLERLDLGLNQLTGQIPRELSLLSRLTELDLSHNGLRGDILRELGGSVNLERLALGDNQLTGEIPSTLGRLKNLTWLDLDRNQLTGEVPRELGDATSLEYLHLGNNQLDGDIPSTLGDLTRLRTLNLGNNKLYGAIPPSLGSLSNLAGLDVRLNQLSGEIPQELGNLTNLTDLRLSGNRLAGKIPAELGQLSKLTVLALDQNELNGEIPASIGSLTSLNSIFLWGNKLAGKNP